MSRLNKSGTIVGSYMLLFNECITIVYKTQKKGDSNPSEQIKQNYVSGISTQDSF
jgi:hypothetical protein